NGLYLGNGVAGRTVDGLGFRPAEVLIKRLDSQQGVHRPASVSGDLTLPAPAAVAFAGGISGFLSDGFQLGTNAAVNSSGKVNAWVAFRDVPSMDLTIGLSPSDSIPNVG